MKKFAWPLLALVLLIAPMVYVACPESEAADGATPWPELYVGNEYTFFLNGSSVGVTVEGYKDEWVYGQGGSKRVYVNMNNVCFYMY